MDGLTEQERLIRLWLTDTGMDRPWLVEMAKELAAVVRSLRLLALEIGEEAAYALSDKKPWSFPSPTWPQMSYVFRVPRELTMVGGVGLNLSLCVYPDGGSNPRLPWPDNILALYKSIQADERAFARTARFSLREENRIRDVDTDTALSLLDGTTTAEEVWSSTEAAWMGFALGTACFVLVASVFVIGLIYIIERLIRWG